MRQGNLEKIKMLLENNPELVNTQDARGNSPPNWAIWGGLEKVAEVLIGGAKVDTPDREGRTPLHIPGFK